jgi:tetratricopeptide (TPR) repeat protein
VGLLALAALGAAIAAVLSSGRTHAGQAQRTSNNPPPRLGHRAQATTDAGITAAPAADPHLLNDDGFALMNRGDYRAALPLLEGAVRDLRGHTDDPYDGYANFNLGLDLIKLGRCADALRYLNTAKRIEPRRPEVDKALEVAGRCVSGGS